MNISNITVGLTGGDLLSIFNDFVSIEELKIYSIDIDDYILIKGNFKKGISIDFECGVKINSAEDDMILGEVCKFRVLNIGIASFFRKIALKYALKSFADKGITYKDGKVYIQYKYLLKDVPYVDLHINDLKCLNGKLNVDIKDIVISLGGELKKEVKLFERAEQDEEVKEAEERGKTEDIYSVGREKVSEKLPSKVKKYKDYIFVIPDIAALLCRLLKDNRVSTKTKLIISGSIAYIALPTDLIPDKIPFIGKIDELAVAFFALNRIVKDVPLYVILENWQGKNDIILVIKNLIEYITNFTGAQNVETLYEFIDEILSV